MYEAGGLIEKLIIDGYLRVLPAELKEENIVREAGAVYLQLRVDDLLVMTRRISTVGIITGQRDGKVFRDYILSLDGAEVLLRVWRESERRISTEELGENAPALAYGVLREYGYVYVSVTSLRRIPPAQMDIFKKQLAVDRKLISRVKRQ